MPRRPVAAVAAAFAMALAGAAATLVAPSGAWAHARLVAAEPADGVAMAHAPGQVRLRFDEDVSPRFRVVRLVDAHGRVVAGTALRAGSSRRELVLTLPPGLRRGAYDVTWEVLAQEDGHVSGGATVFGVGTQPRPGARRAEVPGAAVGPLSAWLRWLDLALLCGLVGAVGMTGLLARAGARDQVGLVAAPRLRLWRVTLVLAAAALLVGLALLARQVHQLGAAVAPGTGAGDVLGVRWGQLWLVREGLLSLLVVMLLAPAGWADRPARARVALATQSAAVTGLVLVQALGSHAAADPHPRFAVGVAAAHLLAAGAWIGGVAAFGLALAALPRRRRPELARACRAPVARIAAIAVGVLAVTGLVQAGAQVASVDALLTTDYGGTLLVKVGLVALAAALGAGNALLLRRGAAPSLLPVEAAAGAGILLAAAVMAASPPARGPEFAAPRAVVAPEIVRHAGDLLITTSVRPNRPGTNVVSVLAVSARRPPPAPVHDVSLSLDDGRTVALAAVAPGRFVGSVELERSGGRRATVALVRGGRRVRVPVRWAVAAPDPARPVVHSARRLAPLTDRAAAALVLLALATALAARAVRPSRRDHALGGRKPTWMWSS